MHSSTCACPQEAAEEPFVSAFGAERCQREVFVASGDEAAPPLIRCKLAVLCAMLHLEDVPYSRCVSSVLKRRGVAVR